jgi:hypothetical protein
MDDKKIVRNPTGQKGLKYPILKKVEYISVLKNGKSVLEYDGSELDGKTWRDFQKWLGDQLAPGHYFFKMKFKGIDEVHQGKIRAISSNPEKTESKMETVEILKEFNKLKDALTKATNTGGVSFEMLLASTKQAYEAQIQYKDQVISDKNDLIREIKKEVDQLESDLNDCEKESAKNSGLSNYLAIGEKILAMKFGTPAKVSLKESNPSDIPDQILQVLGIVNWTIIDAENINRIASNIQQYLSALPKEYLKGE